MIQNTVSKILHGIIFLLTVMIFVFYNTVYQISHRKGGILCLTLRQIDVFDGEGIY